MAYSRVLVKLSGESLMGDSSFGFSASFLDNLADSFLPIHKSGIEAAFVVGGGNFLRGKDLTELGITRVVGDHMGMLATCMNGLVLKDVFEKKGIPSVLFSSIAIDGICECYRFDRAIEYMKRGYFVFLVGGTGNPFFTTDSAACLRAVETNCDVVLKATQVDGVYTADPKIVSAAKRYETVHYDDVISKGLKVMDLSAFAIAKEHDMPIHVFDIHQPSILNDIFSQKKVGTIVSSVETQMYL